MKLNQSVVMQLVPTDELYSFYLINKYFETNESIKLSLLLQEIFRRPDCDTVLNRT